jgi:AbrB family looped-hinge helix DNA binding protein
MNVQRGRLVSGGRLQIPADIRRELGLTDGDGVTMRVIDGQLHIRPLRDVISDIQARVRPYLRNGVSLVDEFIADRRVESERE